MLERKVVSSFALLVSTASVALLSGCSAGAAGEAVRPEAPSASEAMGESPVECSAIPERPTPFVVDWRDDERAELEVAMQRGVVAVAYSCEGIRVLPSCRVEGHYAYASLSPKSRTVELDRSDDLMATLPVSVGSLSSELSRGMRLSLSYTMVGQHGASLDQVPETMLEGSCEGATHVVRAAYVGAFELGTATSGSVAASGNLLGAQAGSSSQSDKRVDFKDGDLSSCKDLSVSSEPTSGCGALVRVALAPVSNEPALDPSVAPANNPCSQGYVLSADGRCTSTSEAYLCDPEDAAECKQQCEKGSAESCFNAARSYFAGGSIDKSQRPEVDAFYARSCDLGFPEGCVQSGLADIRNAGDADITPGLVKLEKACDLGHAGACTAMASAHRGDFGGEARDYEKARFFADRACRLGAQPGCAQLEELQAKL